ncbi:P-loop containing nucleoside triphosphate hydrolase protein [Bisporella sp. PMI_857]|nr:P-loop containing nucleoside triphosphate hydrolase protein [Bisporella sp. PMI_857]
MIDAAEEFFALRPDFAVNFPNFNIRGPIPAPYLFWYHYQGPDSMQGLSPSHEALMRLVTTWTEDNYGQKYAPVDNQVDRGAISQETVPFLFKPGDVIAWEDRTELHAAITRSWPPQTSGLTLSQENKERDWSKGSDSLNPEKCSKRWTVDSWRYDYDGQFLQQEQPIERFVVDFQTYQQLHYSSGNFKVAYPSIGDQDCQRMKPEVMASDEPPPAPEIYIFPNTIPGYDLRSKKWVDLEVDMIRDVTWNKKSFDHLVIDNETKELIQALVFRQIASEQGTDIIDRKGNGLIILLHGGPGTGKIFTAESVAEMAEKPLFRVTCGDIRTKPEEVEKYLESVLHLGKTWGCVVLIDEAEVFLEQRSLDNLERNALLSVFLRVLEYYEGILVLTSNRVGTFDEAFKSRNLSLHYENLAKGQRTKIWKNFISRLKDMDGDGIASKSSGIDFDDVECYLTELAEHELNGRHIRNVITTTRRLATFRGERMSFQHLKHVITVSSKFDILKDGARRIFR